MEEQSTSHSMSFFIRCQVRIPIQVVMRISTMQFCVNVSVQPQGQVSRLEKKAAHRELPVGLTLRATLSQTLAYIEKFLEAAGKEEKCWLGHSPTLRSDEESQPVLSVNLQLRLLSTALGGFHSF
eukprot:4857657-Amphidinium_carterae.1